MKRHHLILIRLCWLSLSLLVWPSLALADTPTPPSPLGFAVGQADLKRVRKELSKKTAVHNAGINFYTKGPMLEVDGGNLGIKRLKRVRFIFDTDKRLVVVLMTFHQGGFDATYSHLASKHTLVSKKIPFVGDKEAKFKNGNVSIVLESPHLGFETNLVYMTQDFKKHFLRKSKDDSRQEKRLERSNF